MLCHYNHFFLISFLSFLSHYSSLAFRQMICRNNRYVYVLVRTNVRRPRTQYMAYQSSSNGFVFLSFPTITFLFFVFFFSFFTPLLFHLASSARRKRITTAEKWSSGVTQSPHHNIFSDDNLYHSLRTPSYTPNSRWSRQALFWKCDPISFPRLHLNSPQLP